jgi:hypothetical protein
MGCFGCTGQTFDGRWAGPLPYQDASECRIQLRANGHFDAVCRDESWVGAGRWEVREGRLRLTYLALARSGNPVADPQPLVLEVTGRGNTLEILDPHTRNRYQWRRILGGD